MWSRTWALLLLLLPLAAQSANILGLFTSSSPSHLIVHIEMMQTLAERGHNVTLLTILPPPIPIPKGINHLIIPPTAERMNEFKSIVAGVTVSPLSQYDFPTWTKFVSVVIDLQQEFLTDTRFTSLYENPHNHFELVFLGYYLNLYQLGVAAKFNCPVIMNWMGGPHDQTDELMGNPSEISYVPTYVTPTAPGERMSFKKRLYRVIRELYMKLIDYIIDGRMKWHYERIFGQEKDFPTYAELKKRVVLVFSNYYSLSEASIRPLVPSYIEVGGVQIKERANELPTDIAQFLDAADEGAIFLSLGTNVKGSALNPQAIQTVYEKLAQLKQRVIWKWDDLTHTPGNASNILYRQWLPQADILAHPRLKLFITHAGKGSVVEAQHYGVPMLALPLFADQPGNAAVMVKWGFGLSLSLRELSGDHFQAALQDLLENEKYATAVKKYSLLYKDRPLTARQSVVFWTEYVLRHKGAYHLQSPRLHMSFVERNNLDVYGLGFLVLGIVCWLLKSFVGMLCGKRQDYTKKLKQQ